MNKLAIIIVNYKTSVLLIDCLLSIKELVLTESLRVVISDNNSPDDSIDRINAFVVKENLQSNVELLSLPENGGFSYGNNEAIRFTLKNYPNVDTFWLLNPDTVVNESPLSLVFQRFNENDKVGIIGTQQTNLSTGEVVSSAFNKLQPFSEFLLAARNGYFFRLFANFTPSYTSPKGAHLCDWVSGASFFIRKELINEIGLMDERFFLYFEEIDLCLRAKSSGWQVWSDPAISIGHKEESSTGVGIGAQRRPKFWYDSRRHFYYKHYGLFGLIRADIGWFIGRLSLLFRHFLGLRANVSSDPKFYMFDLLIGDLKAVFSSVWGKRL